MPSVKPLEHAETHATGIAVMQYQLARLGLSNSGDTRFTPESLASAGDIDLASSPRVVLREPLVLHSPSRAAFLETNIGIATLVLQRYTWSSEQTITSAFQVCKEFLQSAVDLTVRYETEVHESDGIFEDGCEVLYGRAGLLYALLSVSSSLDRSVIPGHLDDADAVKALISEANIDNIIQSIISRGKHGASMYSNEPSHHERRSFPALMWMWYGKRYIGGAHGIGSLNSFLLRTIFT